MNRSHVRAARRAAPLLVGLLALVGCSKTDTPNAPPTPSAVASQAQAVQSSIASAQAARVDQAHGGGPAHEHPAGVPFDSQSPGHGPAMNADDAMGPMGKVRLLGHPPTTNAAGGLPGATGAPHLYHVGAEGFFLEQGTAIGLTADQQAKLSAIKEKADVAYTATQRKLDDAENDLWTLTSAETPDAVKIDAKISEIGRLTAQQRMDRVRAIGTAVAVLSDAQRKAVVALGPTFAPAPGSSGSMNMGGAPAGGMKMGDDAMKMGGGMKMGDDAMKGGGMKMGGSGGMGPSAPKQPAAPGMSPGMGHM